VRRLAVLAVLVLAGCGTGGRTCARNDVAELCLVHQPGADRIEAEGLKPGSTVVIERDGVPSGSQDVGADGRPSGVLALVGGHAEARVEAVAADGERLHLTVRG
jgi:hypothetical protein